MYEVNAITNEILQIKGVVINTDRNIYNSLLAVNSCMAFGLFSQLVSQSAVCMCACLP